MKLEIEVEGDKRKHVVKALESVLHLLRAGNEAGGGIAAGDVRYQFGLKPEHEHKNYIDGEGNVIHTDEEGNIEAILKKDGEMDLDPTAGHLNMTAEAWGDAHGGIREMSGGQLRSIEVPPELKEAFIGLLKGAVGAEDQDAGNEGADDGKAS